MFAGLMPGNIDTIGGVLDILTEIKKYNGCNLDEILNKIANINVVVPITLALKPSDMYIYIKGSIDNKDIEAEVDKVVDFTQDLKATIRKENIENLVSDYNILMLGDLVWLLSMYTFVYDSLTLQGIKEGKELSTKKIALLEEFMQEQDQAHDRGLGLMIQLEGLQRVVGYTKIVAEPELKKVYCDLIQSQVECAYDRELLGDRVKRDTKRNGAIKQLCKKVKETLSR